MEILKVNDNYYQIINQLNTYNEIRAIKIIPKQDSYDIINYQLLCLMLKKRSKTKDVVSFHQQLANLYDFETNISCREFANDIEINYQMRFLPMLRIDDVNSVFLDIINNDYLDINLFNQAKEELILTLKNILDNPQQLITQLTYQHLFKNYLSIKQRLMYLNNVTLDMLHSSLNTLLKTNFTYQIDIFAHQNYPLKLTYNKAINLAKYQLQDNINDLIQDNNNDQANIMIVYKLKNTYTQAQLLLFNQVFGSGADCLLFQIVREKYHLCYSVYGRFYNDLLIIYVGLEPDNINKAQSIINDIITNLTKCDDHTKFMQAKVQLIEALNRNASKDNYNLNLVLNHCYFNKEYDINKLINEINNLDISFINNLAQDLEYININILK